MSLSELIVNAQSVRARLRNPSNAVRDDGIDLKRLPRGFAFTGERKRLFAPVQTIQITKIVAVDEVPIAPEPIQTYRPVSSLAAIFLARQIITIVAADYDLNLAAIVSEVRTDRLVEPRHIAMYLVRIVTKQSFPWIGRQFGGRNHATVIHGIGQTAARIQSDAVFAAKVAALAAQFANSKTQ